MAERSRYKFPVFVVALEVLFVVLFFVFVRYDVEVALPKAVRNNSFPELLNASRANDSTYVDAFLERRRHWQQHEDLDAFLHDKPGQHFEQFYSIFQDVHIIVFVGVGFLMTFLKRYGFSSVGFNFLVGAVMIQWQILVHAWIDHFDDPHHEKLIRLDLTSLLKSDFGAVAVVISMGVVLGKTSPLQLIVMGLFEIVFFEANQKIVFNMLHATDIGDSMVLHIFAAYFGLMVAWILYRRDVHEAEEKEASVYQSDIFSMIGTVFLWICWPSFNAALAAEEGRVRAVINTYLSLTGSLIVTCAISSLLNKKGKLKMEHVQNSSLAGGVAAGSIADLIVGPGAAMLIGMVAGAVSVLGYSFLTPLLSSKLRLHDTCGVHNLHGLPGFISAIASIILVLFATPETYLSNYPLIFGDEVHSPNYLAGIQAACLGISFLFAVVGGVITGFVLRLPIFDQPEVDGLFDDDDNWVIPMDASLHIAAKHSPLHEAV